MVDYQPMRKLISYNFLPVNLVPVVAEKLFSNIHVVHCRNLKVYEKLGMNLKASTI